MLSEAILPAAELTNGSPRFGREGGGVEVPVRRHVDLGLCPGALVAWRHAKARPYILSFLGGLLLGEAVGKAYVAMFEEVLFLSFSEWCCRRAHFGILSTGRLDEEVG